MTDKQLRFAKQSIVYFLHKSEYDGWKNGKIRNHIYEYVAKSGAGLTRDVAIVATNQLIAEGTLTEVTLPPSGGYTKGLEVVRFADGGVA